MAFPSPGTPVDTDFGSSVTNMSVNMPGTVNSGDRLLAFVSVRNAGTWSTVPTGWNERGAQTGGGGGVGRLTIFEKIAAGTEAGTTPQWVHSASTTAAWQVVRVTGAHASTAIECSTGASGDSSSANPASLDPANWATEDTLWFAVAGHAAISAAAFTAAPSGYSGFANNGASSGGSAVSVACGYLQNAAGSEDPGTFTAGGSNRFWAAFTVGVRPAAGSGSQIKKLSGTTQATVKVASTVAIASVKKVSGVTNV